MNVQNKHVLVVGLARSGLAVARALARRGAVVTVTDRRPPAEFADVLPQLLKDKIGLELGSQRVETFLRHEVIVISPGVPWDLPQLQAARDRMIPVYPEVEAATWFLEGTLVGVTGSNGKTTTTALLGDMLKASGFSTFVGGNIGNALSSAVDRAQRDTKFVTELSSFQLEGIHQFRPHVAVMLNLSPNHLDRHPDLDAYAKAKRQIFRNQGGGDYAVLNADDPWVAGLEAAVPSHAVLFSRHRELPNGVFVSEGKIVYRLRHLERVLFETRDVTLRGDFNLENVLAASTAACLLGADFSAIRKAVRAFQAVEHRLEFVRKIQDVDFYNNSKATSVDATAKSLEAFDHGVHLIMGGKDKGAPYAPLLPLIKDRVREVLLIGAAAPLIAEQLAGQAELVQAGDLPTAVREAFARSRPGDTVLLAPACSSFDQFKDYEERGRVFKELVTRLADDVAAGKVPRRAKSEVRGPESGVWGLKPEVRSPAPGVRGLESGILNLESGISKAASHEPWSQRKAHEPPPVETSAAKPSPKPAAVSTTAQVEAATAAVKSSPPLATAPASKPAVLPSPPKAPARVVEPPPVPTAKVAEAPATVPKPVVLPKPEKAPAPVVEVPPVQTVKVAETPPAEVAPLQHPAPQPVREMPPPPVPGAAGKSSPLVILSAAKEPGSPRGSLKKAKPSSPKMRAYTGIAPSSSPGAPATEAQVEKAVEPPPVAEKLPPPVPEAAEKPSPTLILSGAKDHGTSPGSVKKAKPSSPKMRAYTGIAPSSYPGAPAAEAHIEKAVEPPPVAEKTPPPVPEAAEKPSPTVILSAAKDHGTSPGSVKKAKPSSPKMRAYTGSTPSSSPGAQSPEAHAEKAKEPLVSESRVPSPEPRLPIPEPETPSPKPEVPTPGSRVPSPESRIPSPESRVPLAYVYEVDAIEMPARESLAVPQDEPSISISASKPEPPHDEALPYEARPAVTAGVSSPDAPQSGAKGKKKGRVHDQKDAVSKPPQGQPPLPGGE